MPAHDKNENDAMSGFEARPVFRYTPGGNSGEKETFLREDKDGATYYVERHIDCCLKSENGYVRLDFYVMETDSMDTRNEIIFHKGYTYWSDGRHTFPKGFIHNNPWFLMALQGASSRVDKVAEDTIWAVFYNLEIMFYLRSDDCTSAWVKELFPSSWQFWQNHYDQMQLQIIRDVMES